MPVPDCTIKGGVKRVFRIQAGRKKEGKRLDQQLLPIVPSVGSDAHHRVSDALLEPSTDYYP